MTPGKPIALITGASGTLGQSVAKALMAMAQQMARIYERDPRAARYRRMLLSIRSGPITERYGSWSRLLV